MLQKGHGLMKTGDYDEARRAYLGALRREPKSAEIHYHFGNALVSDYQASANQEYLYTAINAYDSAIRLMPNLFRTPF